MAQRELVAIGVAVELLSECVYTGNFIGDAKRVDGRVGSDLVAGKVVVTNVAVAGLVHLDVVRQLHASQPDRIAISSIIRLMALPDLDSIVGQVVLDNIG